MTWLLSFEQIRIKDPLAAAYLCVVACVEPNDVPRALLPAGPSREQETDAMGTLQANTARVIIFDGCIFMGTVLDSRAGPGNALWSLSEPCSSAQDYLGRSALIPSNVCSNWPRFTACWASGRSARSCVSS
ncbi:hypothetical protein B0T14DRAFT_252956 [Immersiella caudata]|uniref:Uncharacterized protein n=1 Tax=Immersiella caudata TaxID=314043 RepID=A0AA40BWZ8_9PEZI|nr:hypothetical protein B0T14DRAFT_252956 [Immersiella caudata]